MAIPIEEDREYLWKCGHCHFRVYYLADEEPPVVCPNCDYKIGERDDQDVPNEVRLRIHR